MVAVVPVGHGLYQIALAFDAPLLTASVIALPSIVTPVVLRKPDADAHTTTIRSDAAAPILHPLNVNTELANAEVSTVGVAVTAKASALPAGAGG
jgi:hypothetical protein